MNPFTSRQQRLISVVVLIILSTSTFLFLIQKMRKPTTPTFQELLSNNDVQCVPPCWQGIVPGKTSVTDGLSELDNIPWVRTETIRHYPKSELYTFRFYPNGVGNLYYKENTITSINLTPVPETVLNEGLEFFGSPKWVTVIIDSRELAYNTQLVFPEKQVVLEAFSIHHEDENYSSNGSSEASIYPDMRLGSIWFYQKGYDASAEEILSGGLGRSLWVRSDKPIVQEWSGYGIYKGGY